MTMPFHISNRAGSRLEWKQVVLMKVVYFCLKINTKLVLYRNFFLLYDFLSLKYLRLAGPSAVFACVRLAQLAGELIAHKNHIKERNIFVKQILHWFLCINKQLLFIQVVFILIWNPPYANTWKARDFLQNFKFWKQITSNVVSHLECLIRIFLSKSVAALLCHVF